MKTHLIAVMGVSFLCAPAVQAAEITGGSVGLSYSAFADDTDFSRLSIEGSLEVGFDRNVSLQFDLGHDRFGETDVDGTTYGLHGIYHLDEMTSLGAFYTNERTEGDDFDIFGVEAGHESGRTEFEGYLAGVDYDGGSSTLFGLSGRYALDNGLGLGASYDKFDDDFGDISTLAVRLDRDVSASTNLHLEIGSAKVSAGGFSDSEMFVGLGGTIAFGADRGATFERRGVLKLIPGL